MVFELNWNSLNLMASLLEVADSESLLGSEKTDIITKFHLMLWDHLIGQTVVLNVNVEKNLVVSELLVSNWVN